MLAIETIGLGHAFATEPVLRDVALAVPRGSIYGFLGPNGAGKTTTLRLILGLLRCQRGSIRVLGQPLDRRLLGRIGSAIETPSLYAHLTAAENLALWRAVYGCPRRRVDEVLRLVGLADAAGRRAGQLSLGMKQRLGLGIALLHQPPLVILDEPTNGLDPHGIIEMRELLAGLNRQHGTTIVVSSHLLSEVERIVTHVGIIGGGTLVFQGTLDALQAGDGGAGHITVDTSDNRRAAALLAAAGWRVRFADDDRLRVAVADAGEAGRLNAQLVAAGLGVHTLAAARRDLEAIFLDLVRTGGRA